MRHACWLAASPRFYRKGNYSLLLANTRLSLGHQSCVWIDRVRVVIPLSRYAGGGGRRPAFRPVPRRLASCGLLLAHGTGAASLACAGGPVFRHVVVYTVDVRREKSPL